MVSRHGGVSKSQSSTCIGIYIDYVNYSHQWLRVFSISLNRKHYSNNFLISHELREY